MNARLQSSFVYAKDQRVQLLLRTCGRHAEIIGKVLIWLGKPARLPRERVAMKDFDRAVAHVSVGCARRFAPDGFREHVFAQHDVKPEWKVARAGAFEHRRATRARARNVNSRHAAAEVTAKASAIRRER